MGLDRPAEVEGKFDFEEGLGDVREMAESPGVSSWGCDILGSGGVTRTVVKMALARDS